MKEKLPVIYFPQRWVRKKKFDQKIYSDYTHYIKKQNAIGYLRSQKEPTIAIWTMILPKFAIERRDNENKYKSPGRYTLEEGKILPGLIAQATARIEELLIK